MKLKHEIWEYHEAMGWGASVVVSRAGVHIAIAFFKWDIEIDVSWRGTPQN